MDPQAPQPNQPAPAPEVPQAPAPGAPQAITPAPAPAPVTPAANAAEATPEVPATWPGAFGLYKYSKSVMKFNLGTALTLYILSFACGAVLTVLLGQLGRVIGEFAGVFVQLALMFTYFASVRGQKISIGQAFSKATPLLYLKFLVLNIFVAVAVAFSALLLLIPFFFVLPRVVLAPYFMLDKNIGPFEAINVSWAATKGYAGMIWGIIGAYLAMALLMVTIIGIPFALYFVFMYSAASVLAYEFIRRTAPAPATPTPQAPAVPSTPAV